jgi:hypothetical protein
VGVTGSFAVSLLVSSSSSSGIGLRRSTGLDSGDDEELIGMRADAGAGFKGTSCDVVILSCCWGTEVGNSLWEGN